MKNVIALIVCLLLISSASSQIALNDTTCCVPCYTLKNALIVKSERDYLKNQIGIVRDSVTLLNVVTRSQDSLISNKNQQISLYKKNETSSQQIIDNKDKQISLYNDIVKEVKTQRNIAYVLVFFTSILGIFAF